jgi:hypothetical protein
MHVKDMRLILLDRQAKCFILPLDLWRNTCEAFTAYRLLNMYLVLGLLAHCVYLI